MEPPPSNKIPPDRSRDNSLNQDTSSVAMSTAVSTQPNSNNQLVLYSADRPSASASFMSLTSNTSGSSNAASSSSSSVVAPIEKLSRPMAFDKVKFNIYFVTLLKFELYQQQFYSLHKN